MAIAITNRVGAAIPIYRVKYHLFSRTISVEDGPTADIDLTRSGGAILLLDWSDVSWDTTTTAQSVESYFSNFLLGTTHNGHSLHELPLHLIGHSRGASLNSALAYSLAYNGVLIDQVTTLDPHPVGLTDAPPGYDWIPQTYFNVLFADNYWQSHVWSFPDGMPIPGTFDQDLSDVVTHLGDLPEEPHTRVHRYYHGTIDLSLGSDGDGNPETNWYLNTRLPETTGYNFSRYPNSSLPRPSNGLNQYFAGSGGTGSRVSVPLTSPQWPNAGFNQRSSIPDTVTVGDNVSIPYYEAHWGSSQTITLSLDADTNPFNGVQRDIGSTSQHVSSAGTVGTNSFSWTATAADVGTHFLRIKANDSAGRTRYDYFLKEITVSPGSYVRPAVETRTAVGTEIGTTTATIRGHVVSDGGLPIDDYRFDWGPNAAALDRAVFKTDITVTGGEFYAPINNLLPGTTYYYRAWAHNGSAQVGPCTTAPGWGCGGIFSFTTGTSLNAPSAPIANLASGITTSGFTANWAGVAGATGYRLDVSTGSDFASNLTGYQNLDAANALSRAVSGLSPGATYYYRVRAYNASGTSPNSGVISVATSPLSQTVATPTINPPGGTYQNLVQVTLSCATPNAAIYSTTDGSDPAPNSVHAAFYGGPFWLNGSVTLKVKAFASGYADSAVASAVFTISTISSGNDRFENRYPLTGASGRVTGSTAAATWDSGANGAPREPLVGRNIPWYSVWFSWTAPASGEVYFSPDWPRTGVNRLVIVGVYTGSDLSSLSQVVASDTSTDPIVRFRTTAGTTYQIQLGELYSTVFGDFTLFWALRGDQSISFAQPPNVKYGDPPFTIDATASSASPVSLSVIAGPAQLISENMLKPTGAGEVQIEARQNGNDSWLPAEPVVRTFSVARAPLTIKADDQTVVEQDPVPNLTASFVGLAYDDTVANLESQPVLTPTGPLAAQPGTYSIIVSGATSHNYDLTFIPGTLTITEARSYFTNSHILAASFQTILMGPIGRQYVIQTASNLIDWSTLATNTIPIGGLPIVDEAHATGRFYRAARCACEPSSIDPLIANGSFELPGVPQTDTVNLVTGSTNLPGWTVGGTGERIFLAHSISTADGTNDLTFNAGDTAPGMWISQTFKTIIGATYQVTFYVRQISGSDSSHMSITASAKSGLGDLLALLNAVPSGPYGLPQEFTFTATSSTTTLEFLDTSTQTTGVDIGLDAISIHKIAP